MYSVISSYDYLTERVYTINGINGIIDTSYTIISSYDYLIIPLMVLNSTVYNTQIDVYHIQKIKVSIYVGSTYGR